MPLNLYQLKLLHLKLKDIPHKQKKKWAEKRKQYVRTIINSINLAFAKKFRYKISRTAGLKVTILRSHATHRASRPSETKSESNTSVRQLNKSRKPKWMGTTITSRGWTPKALGKLAKWVFRSTASPVLTWLKNGKFPPLNALMVSSSKLLSKELWINLSIYLVTHSHQQRWASAKASWVRRLAANRLMRLKRSLTVWSQNTRTIWSNSKEKASIWLKTWRSTSINSYSSKASSRQRIILPSNPMISTSSINK